MRRVLRLAWLWVWLLPLGCATLPGSLEPPRVSLVGLNLLSVELFEQRYQVRLRLKNPNPETLEVRGIDFQLTLNGKDFADGVSNQPLDVAGYGEQVLSLEVSSNLIQVLRLLQGTQENPRPGVDYRISGSVAVGDAYRRLPFDRSGEIALPPSASPAPGGGV